jgi:hypothetical protein
MTATIKGKTLHLELPVQEPALSKSGKSQIVANTRGFAVTTAQVNGKPLRVSVNAIIAI